MPPVALRTFPALQSQRQFLGHAHANIGVDVTEGGESPREEDVLAVQIIVESLRVLCIIQIIHRVRIADSPHIRCNNLAL